VVQLALSDFARRAGYPWDESVGGDHGFSRRRPLLEHLARTANQFWVAEEDGQVVGYARSILRDGLLELTEFFVRPASQSGGLGRRLLERTFSARGAVRRAIVATSDTRALARYLKSGVYARFPLFNFRRIPEPTSVPSDLAFEPMPASPRSLSFMCQIDQTVLGHCRPVDHEWLQEQRAGFVYTRAGMPVGYGYLGDDYGPFALLYPADFPAVLAHAETWAHGQDQADFGFEVPLVNRAAVDYLLGRGYRLEPFFAHFMSDTAFGNFEHYIFFSPPYFM
jgi:GNAT superfamily N-acetyltransferase